MKGVYRLFIQDMYAARYEWIHLQSPSFYHVYDQTSKEKVYVIKLVATGNR